MVRGFDLQAEDRGFESSSGRDNFQTIGPPSYDRPSHIQIWQRTSQRQLPKYRVTEDHISD